MNSGVGSVYFLLSLNQLLGLLKSKITLSEIVENVIEDRFRYVWSNKVSIIRKPYLVLQCGDTLYCDILNEMEIRNSDLARLLLENLICMDAAITMCWM